jgi:hypothetical protein
MTNRKKFENSAWIPAVCLDTHNSIFTLCRMDDWYNVKLEDIEKLGGANILQRYKGVLPELIMDAFRDHTWKPWMFERVPSRWFQSTENISNYIRATHTKLKLSGLQDWYRVTIDQLLAFSTSKYAQVHGLYGALVLTYPEHKWESERLPLAGSRAASYSWLKERLFELLSMKVENKSDSRQGITDFYVPSWQLVVQYTNSSDMQSKKKSYAEMGYTFVPVPFWWDMHAASLGATILLYNPKIKIAEHSKNMLPIPDVPPVQISNTKEKIFMLGQDWEYGDDPKGWWITEKFDGIRAYWDGEEFWSRQLKVMCVPHFYRAALPDIAMDGELWMGRGQFKKVLGLVIARKKSQEKVDSQEDWKNVKYMVFDVPEVDGIYEARMALLKELKICLPKFVSVVEAEQCRSDARIMDHLRCKKKNTVQAKLGG